jgi:hypothetical protein
MPKRLSTEIYPPPSKKRKLNHDDLEPHNTKSQKNIFTFRYRPLALSYTGPRELVTSKITTLYQAISPARLDLMVAIKRNQPVSIQQLAKALNRDYAILARCTNFGKFRTSKVK